jgi:hypothetical protein
MKEDGNRNQETWIAINILFDSNQTTSGMPAFSYTHPVKGLEGNQLLRSFPILAELSYLIMLLSYI